MLISWASEVWRTLTGIKAMDKILETAFQNTRLTAPQTTAFINYNLHEGRICCRGVVLDSIHFRKVYICIYIYIYTHIWAAYTVYTYLYIICKFRYYSCITWFALHYNHTNTRGECCIGDHIQFQQC